MKVTAYKTAKITAGSHNLLEVLDAALPSLTEGSVVAIAAKIVSLSEGRALPIGSANKDDLVRQQSQQYLPRTGKYNIGFAITNNLLIPAAGIDESNSNGHYILWPQHPQRSANAVRKHLARRHAVRNVGVIITDSTTRPLQWGTTGIAIAHSGFKALKDYVGTKDIFGRRLKFQKASILNGLAAAAVTVMGEGAEQTPLAVIENLPFVEFNRRNPTNKELESLRIEPQDDLFWPLLKNAPWKKGRAATKKAVT